MGSTVNEQYQVTDASDGKTSAAIEKINTSSSFVSGTEIDKNIAYYPYSSAVGIAKNATGYTISGIELPATQEYAEGSFGNGAFPMAAVTGSTTDKTLKFKNVLGGLKLQLTGSAKIASIAVTGNADEILCGSANVNVSTTAVPEITLTDTDADAKTVTLDCGTAGVQLNSETATTFIIALPPMTMASGFTVTVTDTYGYKKEIRTENPQTITRSNLLVMPSVNYTGTVEDYSKEPFTITSVGTTTVALVKEGEPSGITLEYRTYNNDWTSYTIGTEISLTDGAILQFRAGEGGNDTFSQSTIDYYKVSVSRRSINVSGNIMSLLDKNLSADSVPNFAFAKLFYQCEELKGASNLKLPAMTLSNDCYNAMFRECSHLTTAPELPATALADACYREMFYWCCDLETAPELPAEILTKHCYLFMFYRCSSLNTAPHLPATTLVKNCYADMFNNCSKLNNIKALFTTEPSDTYTKDWLSGVASTGTFVKSKDATWNVTGVNGVPEGWTVTTE